jgi:hypothetical protein
MAQRAERLRGGGQNFGTVFDRTMCDFNRNLEDPRPRLLIAQ